MKLFVLPALLLACAAIAAPVEKLPPAIVRPVDFLKDIQPIFEAKCAKCHGPEKQKGGYRLDSKAAALTGGDEHAPNILPGKSAESPLIQFVAGLDPEMKMPSKGEPLTAEQIGLLRAWIDQGAVWPASKSDIAKKDPLDWWSLKPLAKTVPEEKGGNPIDAFIRAKLSEKGLAPSPQADPRTLARRIYFDLIGLPPTQEEVDAFAADSARDSQAAIGSLADKLLASPRYGERWARHWLDVVHYGDTHGYDKDKPRPNAWPYRDYVIRALNSDKPYSRFVQEQIAGDALFPNTEDGMTALGFIAAGPWDFIGHAELPESKTDGKIARMLDRDDMVANTMNSFCALTVQCARCHNHKFDPVKQEDYYRLQAVFSALDRTDKSFDIDPAVAQRRVLLEAKTKALEQQKKDLEAKLAPGGGKLALLGKLIDESRKAEAVQRPEFGYHSGIEARQESIKWVQVDLGKPAAISTILYAGCYDDFNNIGAGFGFPIRFKVEISNDSKFSDGVTAIEDQTQTDFPNPGVKPRSIALNGKTARYIRFTATKLATRMNDYILALAEVQALDVAGHNLALGATVTSLDSVDVVPRWSRGNLVDGYYYGYKASPSQLAELEKERSELMTRRPDDPAVAELAGVEKELASAKNESQKLPPVKVVYSGGVFSGSGAFAGTGGNGGKPRPIFVLKRGDVGQPGEEVGPGTVPLGAQLPSKFEISPEQPESARRAALANWITDKNNPLAWRVIVNRVWQYHFGRGLVDSPNDFGRMGQLPTHPELLDWLATEFRDGNQSLKALHRLMVTSATYQQASAGNADAEKIDSNNTLLWRMNRRKLEAEAMHDSLLAVAGKLDLKMGGPGYQDFVIEKAEHSPHYEYGLHDVEDPKAFRRSIYRFIVRSQPQPFMTVLDCADPSMLVDKRNETVNALQALALRNNKLTIAMAMHFAERVALISSDPKAQITAAYRLAFEREPAAAESEALIPFLKEHGLANACRVILNLNEFAFAD
ncbi:MAG: hypothetical protein JWL59_4121 [Chthoniobacteraceae bacterium]|nr:hypothetical protein [Chthoniobacteraceae bacterium]